jgi:phosphate transport system permease protein
MTATPSNPIPKEPSREDSPAAEIYAPLPKVRTIFDVGMTSIVFALTLLALSPLLAILIEILRQGASHLKPEVFTALPAPSGMQGVPNGFANAIVGTIVMVAIASLISIPFGVMTGIFLSEFGKSSAVASTVRFLTTILTGVPSIVVGVFAYGVIVLTTIFGHRGFSAVAGGFALSIIMLPIVALTTEQALKLVPTAQRLGSAGLGASRLQTTFRIVVAAALPAMTTGVLLAVARAAGETAPLLFTAFFAQNWSEGLFSPTPSLSVLIYNYAQSPDTEQNQLAWTASLVLVSLILCISIFSRLVINRRLKVRG